MFLSIYHFHTLIIKHKSVLNNHMNIKVNFNHVLMYASILSPEMMDFVWIQCSSSLTPHMANPQ